MKQFLSAVIRSMNTLNQEGAKQLLVVRLWNSMTQCSEADQKGCPSPHPPNSHIHVSMFPIMLEEEGSTGYIGHIGCTAPRSFVPNRHIVALKKKEKRERQRKVVRISW